LSQRSCNCRIVFHLPKCHCRYIPTLT
jgi:hypothetical protein